MASLLTMHTTHGTAPMTRKPASLLVRFRKAPLVIGSFGLILVLIYVGARFIILDSFIQLEKEEMERNITRAESLINDELEHLSTIGIDYSGWDDAYQFVQDRNSKFVDSNLTAESFSKLGVSVIAYTDLKGEPAYEGAYDLDQGKTVEFPADLREHLAQGKPLVTFSTPNSNFTGILHLSEGALLVAGQPILTSIYKGPIMGALVVGKFLSPKAIEKIEDSLQLPVTVFHATDDNLPAELNTLPPLLAEEHRRILQSESGDQTHGYGMLPGIDGKTTLILRIDAPRSISQKGQSSIAYFFGWIVLIGSLTIGFLLWGINRLNTSLQRTQQSEERYRALFARAGDGIFIMSSDGKLVEVNDSFARMHGYTVHEMQQMNLMDLDTAENTRLVPERMSQPNLTRR